MPMGAMSEPQSTQETGRPGRARRQPLFSKLRVRLLALVLLAILPALGLVLYTALEQRRSAKTEGTATAVRLVRLAAATQKQYLDTSKQLLTTLSLLRDVRPERAEDAEALFRSLLALHPIYANIGAIDPEGYLFASAVPVTNRVYLGDRSYFTGARDTRKLVVGEYQEGRITGKPTLNLAMPLFGRLTGTFHGVVYVSLDLNWLNQLAAREELPDGSTLTVVDRHARILVRYSIPESERNWVGESMGTNQRVREFLSSAGERVTVAKGLDRVERLYASMPLNRTGGIADAQVVVGIPVKIAYAAANHLLVQNLIILGIVAGLALGAAWIASDMFVLRQIRGLVTAARTMREGTLSARSGVEHGPGEIGDLAQSFDEMAAALESRVGELQRAEAELKSLNEDLEKRVIDRTMELKRSNEDLEQFAYVASHDLQEPLRMINNYLQLLRQRYKDQLDTNAHDFIGFALDGSKRMHQLIHDLLAYSRVGTHGKEFSVTESDQALDDALANLTVAIEESGARITRDVLPPVMGDEVQLTQLFQNLVGNAVKFRGEAVPEVHIGVQRKGSEWEYSVRDNGIGIAEQDYQRIFVVFQRLHSREKYPGTGIGLAVCKKIVERHGGRIWVESKPGRGTAFHFTIPSLS
jgi:signal transduction histidine kinase